MPRTLVATPDPDDFEPEPAYVMTWTAPNGVTTTFTWDDAPPRGQA